MIIRVGTSGQPRLSQLHQKRQCKGLLRRSDRLPISCPETKNLGLKWVLLNNNYYEYNIWNADVAFCPSLKASNALKVPSLLDATSVVFVQPLRLHVDTSSSQGVKDLALPFISGHLHASLRFIFIFTSQCNQCVCFRELSRCSFRFRRWWFIFCLLSVGDDNHLLTTNCRGLFLFISKASDISTSHPLNERPLSHRSCQTSNGNVFISLNLWAFKSKKKATIWIFTYVNSWVKNQNAVISNPNSFARCSWGLVVIIATQSSFRKLSRSHSKLLERPTTSPAWCLIHTACHFPSYFQSHNTTIYCPFTISNWPYIQKEVLFTQPPTIDTDTGNVWIYVFMNVLWQSCNADLSRLSNPIEIKFNMLAGGCSPAPIMHFYALCYHFHIMKLLWLEICCISTNLFIQFNSFSGRWIHLKSSGDRKCLLLKSLNGNSALTFSTNNTHCTVFCLYLCNG